MEPSWWGIMEYTYTNFERRVSYAHVKKAYGIVKHLSHTNDPFCVFCEGSNPFRKRSALQNFDLVEDLVQCVKVTNSR